MFNSCFSSPLVTDKEVRVCIYVVNVVYVVCVWVDGWVHVCMVSLVTHTYMSSSNATWGIYQSLQLVSHHPKFIPCFIISYRGQIIVFHKGVLVLAIFGSFSPSRFSHSYCNAMTKAIKVHENLHTNQQNEHTPGPIVHQW